MTPGALLLILISFGKFNEVQSKINCAIVSGSSLLSSILLNGETSAITLRSSGNILLLASYVPRHTASMWVIVSGTNSDDGHRRYCGSEPRPLHMC